MACLLACVCFVVTTRRETKPKSPQAVVEPRVRFADFIKPIESAVGSNPELYRVLLVLELMRAEPLSPRGKVRSTTLSSAMSRLSREVLRFRDVVTFNDVLATIPDEARLPRSRVEAPPAAGDGPASERAVPLVADAREDAIAPVPEAVRGASAPPCSRRLLRRGV